MITLSSVVGMTQVNNLPFTITVIDATHFSIGVSTTGHAAYASGGNASSGYSPAGSACVLFVNIGDSHLTNCVLQGAQYGLTHDGTGIHDSKIVNVHCWNFQANGKMMAGFKVTGSNMLIGCQVDGPWEDGGAAYHFEDGRNQLIGCAVIYEGVENVSSNGLAYPIRLNAGVGGVSAIGCSWKAQSGTYRLAGDATGDMDRFVEYGTSFLNLVSPPSSEFNRISRDGGHAFTQQNSHAGASATVERRMITNAGTLFEIARSVAGGGTGVVDWTGAGGLYVSAGNAGGAVNVQTNYTDRLRVGSGGNIYAPGAETTASAANAVLNPGSTPANELLRSTSSAAYKRDIEPLEEARAEAILNLKPVWYRSKARADNPAWSWYGLIAEEVAAIEPRLVQWGYQDDAWEEVSINLPDGSHRIERCLKEGAELVPDGVAYDRLGVMLLALLKRQEARIARLEASRG